MKSIVVKGKEFSVQRMGTTMVVRMLDRELTAEITHDGQHWNGAMKAWPTPQAAIQATCLAMISQLEREEERRRARDAEDKRVSEFFDRITDIDWGQDHMTIGGGRLDE